MKPFFLSITFLACILGTGFAQDPEHPIKWHFSIEKGESNHYFIKAQAELADDFHIWALDAGGDGSLIATSFDFEKENKIRWEADWTESPQPIAHDLEYVEGTVHWHEDSIIFSRAFVADHPQAISGKVTYQICNAQSCFPPESKSFKLQVK